MFLSICTCLDIILQANSVAATVPSWILDQEACSFGDVGFVRVPTAA